MLSLTLTLALAATPGGFLSETPVSARHARFIDTPLAFAGGLVTGQSVPYAQMTSLAELQAARAEEEAKRGSAGGFAAMMVVGALGVFVAGPILLYVSLLTGLSSGGGLSVLFIASLVTMGVGVVLFGVGLGLMIATIVRNSKASHNIRVIDRRMRELQQMQQQPQYQQPYAPQPYAPQPQYAPPPPPPQGFFNVEPTLELASF